MACNNCTVNVNKVTCSKCSTARQHTVMGTFH